MQKKEDFSISSHTVDNKAHSTHIYDDDEVFGNLTKRAMI
jgi:hypothetical protein